MRFFKIAIVVAVLMPDMAFAGSPCAPSCSAPVPCAPVCKQPRQKKCRKPILHRRQCTCPGYTTETTTVSYGPGGGYGHYQYNSPGYSYESYHQAPAQATYAYATGVVPTLQTPLAVPQSPTKSTPQAPSKNPPQPAPQPVPQTTPTAPPPPASSSSVPMVQAGDPYGFTAWLNGIRAQHGLRAVGYDPNLAALAASNNAHQARRGLGHFVMGGARRQNAGMAGDARNIGARWMASPAHRANMLAPDISYIGLAYNSNYWTLNAR